LMNLAKLKKKNVKTQINKITGENGILQQILMKFRGLIRNILKTHYNKLENIDIYIFRHIYIYILTKKILKIWTDLQQAMRLKQ
jgi:hypothetical protein